MFCILLSIYLAPYSTLHFLGNFIFDRMNYFKLSSFKNFLLIIIGYIIMSFAGVSLLFSADKALYYQYHIVSSIGLLMIFMGLSKLLYQLRYKSLIYSIPLSSYYSVFILHFPLMHLLNNYVGSTWTYFFVVLISIIHFVLFENIIYKRISNLLFGRLLRF